MLGTHRLTAHVSDMSNHRTTKFHLSEDAKSISFLSLTFCKSWHLVLYFHPHIAMERGLNLPEGVDGVYQPTFERGHG